MGESFSTETTIDDFLVSRWEAAKHKHENRALIGNRAPNRLELTWLAHLLAHAMKQVPFRLEQLVKLIFRSLSDNLLEAFEDSCFKICF